MSHEILERDAQQGIQMAWHKLTKVVPEITFEASPLNWTLERRPLFRKVGDDYVPYHQEEIVASDDQLPVGDAVGESYGVIQNVQLWNALMEGLAGCAVPFRVASIGSVCNRTKVFISVELNEGSKFTVGNREFQFFLNALSTHDGTGKAMFLDSSICTVCANTFGFNVNAFLRKKSEGIKFAVRHTKNSGLHVLNAAEGINALISNRGVFCEQLSRLGDQKVTENDAYTFIVGTIAAPGADETGKVSKRALNTADELLGLWKRGAGNQGENRLDLFSAFTDHYTHAHSGREVSQQFVSSEFGSGQRMKELVFQTLRDDDKFSEVKKRGEGLVLVS